MADLTNPSDSTEHGQLLGITVREQRLVATAPSIAISSSAPAQGERHTLQWQGHSLASRVELIDGKQLTVLQNMGCSYNPELPGNLEKFPDRFASQGNLEEENAPAAACKKESTITIPKTHKHICNLLRCVSDDGFPTCTTEACGRLIDERQA